MIESFANALTIVMETLDQHDTELARLIVDNAVDYAIFTMDPEGLITRWGRGAEKVLGYSRAEAIGMDFATLFSPSDREAGMSGVELNTAMIKGRAEDTRWHLRKTGERFWANGVTMVVNGSNPTVLLKIMRDETSAKLADNQRVLLLNELNHRIKNTLTIVQSIAEQTLRSGGDAAATRRSLIDRIMALSQAHNVLVEQNWAGADLLTIVRQAVAPHDQTSTAVTVDGPEVRLSPSQAVSMSLIIHELGTNAVKYGALSTPTGTVNLSWNLGQNGLGARSLTFLWQEAGGPTVHPPATRGFGSRMIARAMSENASGQARLEFPAEGVRCVLVMPLSIAEELNGSLAVGSQTEPPQSQA
jgi:PAS domain S-box-containing protein